MRLVAPAKLNLCLYLGPRRADGLHELVSLFEPLALSDAIEVTQLPDGAPRRGPLPRGRGREPGGAGAGGAARGAAGTGRRCGCRSRSGSRSRPGSAAAAPTRRRCCGWRLASFSRMARGTRQACHGRTCRRSRRSWAPTCRRSCGRRWRWCGGAGERVEPLPAPPAHAALLLSHGGGLSTAEVFKEADRLGLGRDEPELEDLAVQLRAATAGGAPPAPTTSTCWSTTSSRRRARCGRRSAPRCEALRAPRRR